MKHIIRVMMWMAVLTLVWACSSDDNEGTATFSSGLKPSWTVDWQYNDPAPSWKEPESTLFECSMDVLVELDDELLPYSTDADRMAMFINSECRGVSMRNVMANGRVYFLLHVKGTSEEAGSVLHLRYYCDSVNHLFMEDEIVHFTPNNVMDDTFQFVFSPVERSSKYPFYTQLVVMLPENLPFKLTEDDMMAVFVGDECRGICKANTDMYPGWRGIVYKRWAEEEVEVRFYSADKKGIYNLSPKVVLNDYMKTYNASF